MDTAIVNKALIYLFLVCSLLVSCHREKEEECCTCESMEPCDIYVIAKMSAGRPAKQGIWDYPVKQGTEEWKEFKTTEEMVQACQIPEEVLSSLSTEDLTYICLRYPFLWDVFVFEDWNFFANRLYNEFNGIRELFKREEVSKELLKYYNCLMQNISVLDSEAIEVRASFYFSILELEFLLGFYTQKADVLSIGDCKQMLLCLIHGSEKENEKEIDYGVFYTNFYARAHVIIKMSPESIEKIPSKDQNYVFSSKYRVDKETLDIINKLSYQLFK